MEVVRCHFVMPLHREYGCNPPKLCKQLLNPSLVHRLEMVESVYTALNGVRSYSPALPPASQCFPM